MFTSAIQKVSKSIFPLFNYAPNGCGVLGTGFFIDDQGHFLTAAHVINALPKGQKIGYLGNIPYSNFKGKKFNAVSIVKIDAAKDLALGKVDEDLLAPLIISESKAVVGQSISLCGYPLPMIQITNKEVAQQKGSVPLNFDVSSVRQYWQPTIKMDEFKPDFILNKKFRSFITQHAALPGMSGGPIFNLDGEVIGLTSAVWPRKVPVNQTAHIDIPNGIGVELSEIKGFLESVGEEVA